MTIDSAVQGRGPQDGAGGRPPEGGARRRSGPGRATPAVLNRVTVEYYGTPVPLNQLASINVPEPRLLQVQPFDKTAIGAIEKAIQSSDLGITPSNDGNVIRLAFPPLTEERRGAGQAGAHAGRGGPGRRAQRPAPREGRDGEA